MIHDEEFETLPREALETIQLKRLKDLAERVYATVPFYKKAFDEKGVKADTSHVYRPPMLRDSQYYQSVEDHFVCVQGRFYGWFE